MSAPCPGLFSRYRSGCRCPLCLVAARKRTEKRTKATRAAKAPKQKPAGSCCFCGTSEGLRYCFRNRHMAENVYVCSDPAVECLRRARLRREEVTE